MGVIKYKDGDYVGPHNLKMIKRLPKEEWRGKGKRPKPEGIFICPKCNKEFQAVIGNVASGNTSACNGHKKEIMADLMSKDITGQRFGLLTAIKWTGEYKGTNRVWLCQCDCGNFKEADINSLTQGKVLSCGCSSKSKGELKVRELLKKLNLNYKEEYKFNNCLNPKTQKKMRFDFYLLDYNCCIEYDGVQHFKKINNSGNWGKATSLEENQKRDNIKNQYCKDNNIKLIRIPYTDYNILDEEYIMERLNNLEKYDYNIQNNLTQ